MQVPSDADLPIILEIFKESDRGAAVIGGGFLEAKLTDAIKTFLRDDKEISNLLFGEGGPVGSFAAKIRVGYMLSFYGKESMQDLVFISKIRNKFAHTADPTDFGSPYILDKCEKLTIYNKVWQLNRATPFGKNNAKTEFLGTISLFVNTLHSKVNYPSLQIIPLP